MKYLGVPQSGSEAATVASHNRFGQYYRNRSVPVNANTPNQMSRRTRMANVASSWRGLTGAQKAAWGGYASGLTWVDALGQTHSPSGFGAYCQVNMLRLSAGEAIDPAVPGIAPLAVISFTPTITAGAFSAAFTPDPMDAGVTVAVEASAIQSAGRQVAPGPGGWKRIAAIAPAAASPLVFTGGWTAAYGTAPTAGDVVFFRVRPILDGVAGVWQTYRVVAT